MVFRWKRLIGQSQPRQVIEPIPPLDPPNQPEEVDPFDIQDLPSSLHLRILRKLEESSQFGKNLCEVGTALHIRFTVNHVIVTADGICACFVNPLYRSEPPPKIPFESIKSTCSIHAETIIFCCNLDSEIYPLVAKQFREKKLTCNSIALTFHIICTKDELASLLTPLNPDWIQLTHNIPASFLTIPIIKEANSLSTNNIIGMSDRHLLALNAKEFSFECRGVTDFGINLFLKQWKNGQREFNVLDMIFSDGSSRITATPNIIEGLDANLIWSRDHHEDSYLGRVRMSYVDNPEELIAAYSFWKPDDISDYRTIERIMVQKRTEISILQCLVDDNVFSAIYFCCTECEDVLECRHHYNSHPVTYLQPRNYRSLRSRLTRSFRAIRNLFRRN